jgi:hypothetical protein
MARRTGRRDRGVRGSPAWWPTTTLGRHAMGDGPGAGGVGGIRGTRAEEKESTGVSKGGK